MTDKTIQIQDQDRVVFEQLARQIKCPVASLLFLVDSRYETETLSDIITIPKRSGAD